LGKKNRVEKKTFEGIGKKPKYKPKFEWACFEDSLILCCTSLNNSLQDFVNICFKKSPQKDKEQKK